MTDLLLEPWPLRGTGPHEPTPTITTAIQSATDRLTTERGVRAIIREGLVSSTPNLDGLQNVFANFTTRVDGLAKKLADRMQSVGDYTENAVTKFGNGVDKIEATAKAIDNAANQMTNGGPPLAGSSGQQGG